MIMQQIRFISSSVVELKEMVKGLDERVRQMELAEAGCQAVNINKIESAHNRIDGMRRSIEVIDDRVQTIETKMPLVDELLAVKNKLIVIVALAGFIGTVVGGLVITLVFNLAMKGF